MPASPRIPTVETRILTVNTNRLEIGFRLLDPLPSPPHLLIEQDPYTRTLPIAADQEDPFHLYLNPGWNQISLRAVSSWPSGSVVVELNPEQVVDGFDEIAPIDPSVEHGLQIKVQCGVLAPRRVGRMGSIDQSLRSFSASELALASILEEEGWDVKSLPVGNQVGQRRADCEVRDPFIGESITVEFKQLVTGSTAVQLRRAVRQSLRGTGQARHIVIDARGSGLTSADAAEGLKLIRSPAQGRLNSARIVGRDYDFSQEYPYRIWTPKDPQRLFQD